MAPMWSVPVGPGISIGGAAISVPGADSTLVVFSAALGGAPVVVALDASTGARRWVRSLPGTNSLDESVLVLTPTAVIRSSVTRLTVLDRSGVVVWDSTFAEVGALSWATARGDTVVAAWGWTVGAWRISSGVRLWRRDYPRDSTLVRLTGVTVSGDSVYASGTRFTGGATKQAVILAMRLGTGGVLWSLERDSVEHGHFLAAPAVVGSLLLLTDFGVGGLQAFDRFTRTQVWRTVGLPCCVGGSGTPLAQGGVVFHAGGDETVRAVDLATGVERWRAQSEGGFSAQAVLCDGRFWATNLALRAYDLGTGAPQGVAVDGTEEYASSGLATARGLVFVAGQQRFYAFACN